MGKGLVAGDFFKIKKAGTRYDPTCAKLHIFLDAIYLAVLHSISVKSMESWMKEVMRIEKIWIILCFAAGCNVKLCLGEVR